MESILIILILTIINGYFACVEMAIVSVNKHKLSTMANNGNKKAITILKILDEPTQFLSTIQVAITLAGFFSSAFAATGLADDFQKIFLEYGIHISTSVATIIITLLLSYVTLVFGELVPKRIAIRHANSISLVCVNSIVFVSKITKLFVLLLTISTKAVLRLFNIKDEVVTDAVTREEVHQILAQSKETGAIDEYEKELIESVLEFDTTMAHEIMVARNDVICIDIDKPFNTYLESLLLRRHTRVPVYKESLDKIIGVLHIKDVMYNAYINGFENIKVQEIMVEPYFVPETKNIDDLIRELQATKNHIAILIDEYGGFSGIVTMEDLLEEIVGPIDEEDDVVKVYVDKIDENSYRLYGLITLDELEELCNITIDDNDCNTVSGLLVKYLGKIPQTVGETVLVDDYEFTIEMISNKRVEKCIIRKIK